MIIGLTGGIGTGKSTVLKMLKNEYGAVVFCADEYGHRSMEPDSEIFARIIEMFGKEILDESGRIDRNILANIVYAENRKLMMLNEIVHPYVWNMIEDELKKCSDSPLIVIESAILIESGYSRACDSIWGVFTPKEMRLERLKRSRGFSEEKFANIIHKQMNEWELRSHCDEIIVNDGGLDELKEQIEKLLGTMDKI